MGHRMSAPPTSVCIREEVFPSLSTLYMLIIFMTCFVTFHVVITLLSCESFVSMEIVFSYSGQVLLLS